MSRCVGIPRIHQEDGKTLKKSDEQRKKRKKHKLEANRFGDLSSKNLRNKNEWRKAQGFPDMYFTYHQYLDINIPISFRLKQNCITILPSFFSPTLSRVSLSNPFHTPTLKLIFFFSLEIIVTYMQGGQPQSIHTTNKNGLKMYCTHTHTHTDILQVLKYMTWDTGQ